MGSPCVLESVAVSNVLPGFALKLLRLACGEQGTEWPGLSNGGVMEIVEKETADLTAASFKLQGALEGECGETTLLRAVSTLCLFSSSKK